MEHTHIIYDTDPHFSVDPITRAITNQSSEKTMIMQNDHNSERFTFEMPRHIEGHDMAESNKVEIHYINIGDSGRRSSGMYEVTDLQPSPNDPENVIVWSWLISGDATALVGPLTFAIRFACITGDVIDYDWHTGIHNGISVGTSINNSATIVQKYIDVLQSWYQEFIAAGNTRLTKIEEATTKALNDISTAGKNAANVAAADILPLLKQELIDEKELAVETIKVQADEIVNLVLERFPIAEEASF